MAGSARFGGQIDASGILGDIYESELRNREALAGAAAGRAREEQNALDRDAQSRWQAGEMSDEDWLAYVRQRVRESAQFPEEHAEWEKMLRETSDMIAVNQAEFAFQQGGSINQLIAFYQQRAKGGNSVAGREAQERLNQLLDQRLSDEVTRNVENIQDQIDAGQAKPQVLLDYLRGARRQARSNSDLARSLDKDIEQVDDQIAQFNREYAIQNLQHQWQSGKISGDEYAAGMRAAAAPYASTDPSTYFSLLAEANVGERYGRFGFDGAAGGGGGRGPGGGGGSRGGGPISLNGLTSEWEDRRWRASDILGQVMAGKTEVVDPGTGDRVDVTTAAGRRWLENVNRDAFSTFAAQRRIGAELGDREMIDQATTGHEEFLLNLTQPSNTMLEREAAGYMIQSISNRIMALDKEYDPVLAQRELIRAADRVDQFIANRTSNVVESDRARSADGAVTGGSVRGRRPEETVDPTFIGELQMLSGALRTGEVNEDLNVTKGVGDLLNADDMKMFSSAAATINDKATGMGTRWTYAVLPGEGVSVVPMVMGTRQQVDPESGAAVITQVPMVDPKVLSDLGIKPGETHNPVAVAVQVGDSVIRMNGYSAMQSTPWSYWQAAAAFETSDGRKIGKGLALNSEIYKAISDEERADLIASGTLVRTAYAVETFQAPDASGRLHTFTRIPGGSWVKGALPIKPNMLPDGTVALDADGSISGASRPVESVPVPFIGRDPKLAQEAVDRGEFDDVISQIRGVNWETMDALPSAFDPTGSFWNEEDEARRRVETQARQALSERGPWGLVLPDWWNQKSRGQRAADKWATDKRATREANKERSEGDMARNAMATNPMADLFKNEGSALGLSFGYQRAQQPEQRPAERTPSSWPIQQMPRSPSPLPRIGQPNKVRPGIDFLPSRLPAPQASSGPFVSRTQDRPTAKPQPAALMPSFLSRLLRLRTPTSTPPRNTTSGDSPRTGTSGGARVT
jgi:hypothetical protein